MAKFVDPKETLERVAAQEKLNKVIQVNRFDGPRFFQQARNKRVQLLMKDGCIRDVFVYLSTNETVACKDLPNDSIKHPMLKLSIKDVMDGGIL